MATGFCSLICHLWLFSFCVYFVSRLMDFSNERVARTRALHRPSHDWHTGRHGTDVYHHMRCTSFVQPVSWDTVMQIFVLCSLFPVVLWNFISWLQNRITISLRLLSTTYSSSIYTMETSQCDGKSGHISFRCKAHLLRVMASTGKGTRKLI